MQTNKYRLTYCPNPIKFESFEIIINTNPFLIYDIHQNTNTTTISQKRYKQKIGSPHIVKCDNRSRSSSSKKGSALVYFFGTNNAQQIYTLLILPKLQPHIFWCVMRTRHECATYKKKKKLHKAPENSHLNNQTNVFFFKHLYIYINPFRFAGYVMRERSSQIINKNPKARQYTAEEHNAHSKIYICCAVEGLTKGVDPHVDYGVDGLVVVRLLLDEARCEFER